MDGWKYVTESGRKESGFVILKTRFQDCNLSRKQESRLSAKKTRNKEREKEVIPAFELSTWNERKPSVNLYGWNEIKMYHKKELLQ